MKKNNFLKILGALMIATALFPLASMAQNVKEFYLRPSYWRPYDQRGINVFETSKAPDTIAFEGPRVRLGAGFTQGFQALKHENTANNSETLNKLYPLTPGFNTASANLNFDVQLADGIRMNVTSYLSSRHHNETWVKGGYIQFDKLPFKGKLWSDVMDVVTIKVGHMEINYGDAHFRRSDGGQTIYNPFAENYIIDGYATEIGGEIYAQKNGFLVMGGISNGMIKGNVDSLADAKDGNLHKSPAIYGKLAFEKSYAPKLRIRGAASYYHNGSSGGNTLFGGDRTGSNYFMVMEKSGSTYAGQAFSGRLNPGFGKKVDALQLNGFAKVGGLELFGTYEWGQGYAKTESVSRNFVQWAGDAVYRLGRTENLFLGMRYNTVRAELAGVPNKVNVERVAATAGWFVTKNVLLKGEYVEQWYRDFQANDYRNGGKFNGYVIHAVVGF